MRFDITFQLTKPEYENILPINYQYPLSAWIYKTLNRANSELSKDLHDEGYALGTKQFKFFSFSNLRFPKYGYQVLRPDRLRIKKNRCYLTISLAVDKTISSFVLGLFKEMTVRIGDRISQVSMEVHQISHIEETEFEEGKSYRFQTLSPVCVSDRIEGNRLPQYLSPMEENFARIFVGNLYNKYLAMQKYGLYKGEHELPDGWEVEDGVFRLLNEPKRKIITIKDHTPQKTKYRAYAFDFELTLPPILLEIGYAAGFGEKNSVGFGCCRVKNR